MAESSPSAPKEDILRIEAEDPVFYIGPETRPQRPATTRPLSFNQWLWGQNSARRAVAAKRASMPRRAERPRPAPRPQTVARTVQAPAPEPEPLGPPPPLPSVRVRVAELTGSMLGAAPVTLVGSLLLLPVMELFLNGPKSDPRQMAVVFGMALLTSWTFLTAGKLWESNPHGLGPRTGFRKQLLMLLPGALVGLSGFGLWQASHAGPISSNSVVVEALNLRASPLAGAVAFASYMAIMFASLAWWKVTARNRGARLQIWPIVASGTLGTGLGLLSLPVLPVAPLAFSLGIFAAQMVSPWSRTARDYKREFQAANRRAGRNVA